MNEDIENAVRESIALLARDPKRHNELWALAKDRDRELAGEMAAVEGLLGSDLDDPSIDDSLIDAFLNKLLDSGPAESGFFDSGAAGGGDELSVYELPNGMTLVCSLGSGWHGPYPSIAEALDLWSLPTIEIWLSDDFSDELSAVPDDVDSIKIEDEAYHRFDGSWCTDEGGPMYVLYRGTWMSESDAHDAESSEGTDPV